MNSVSHTRWRKLKDVFTEVSELSPGERLEYLSKLRFNEKTFYEEIIELLEVEDSAQNFLHAPISFGSVHSLINETVGHYKILGEIGRGGMSAVFEAERQDGEFDHIVAIKLTDRSFLSGESVKRFLKERQILAKLEHPNIVRLLDGGVTESKTPYIVMERIDGSLITVYCKENKLDVRKKLKIFLQVCAAVAYAHRRLIVHRDLKPSNILVTKDGQVKLLDFGIAKTLDLDPSIQTRTQNAPMTPEYASPEQIKGEMVTTTSDVYSLGVILYELLTERSPCEIYGISQLELPRGICEAEPSRPSAGAKSPAGTTLSKELRGDLDNIILKTLQKEPERRYVSVEQFAEDIEAHLNGFPVKAHPQSWVYHVRKFVKRQRTLVVLVAASLLLVTGGVALAAWQYTNAERQRQMAERNFNQVRKIANSMILDYHDEIAKLEGSTKLREKLVTDAVSYLDAISQGETNDPSLLKELAVAYRKVGAVQGMPFAANLGKNDDAVTSYEKSVSLLEKAVVIAPQDPVLKDELARSYNEMGQALLRTGVNSKDILQKALMISEELVAIDPNNIERGVYNLRLRMVNVGLQKEDSDTFKEYDEILADASSLNQKYPENVEVVAILAITNERVGNLYRAMGNKLEDKPDKVSQAQAFYRQAVGFSEQSLKYMQLRQSLDPNDGNNRRRLFVANSNMAAVMIYLNRFAEGEYYQGVSEKIVRQLREKDPNNKETALDEAAAYKNKFNLLEKQGKFKLAREKARTAIEILKEYYRSNPQNSEALGWLGLFYNKLIRLLEKQKLETEVRIYRGLFEKVKEDFAQKFYEGEEYHDNGR